MSPSKTNARKRSQPVSPESLTLSQALLITAGLAGLVGLCSGAFLRFSLANSPDTRFLSPLQTFPALSNWTPESPQETADLPTPSGGENGYEERGDRADLDTAQATSNILTFEPAAPIDSNQSSPIDDSLNTKITVDSKSTDITTFDAFAARENGRQRTVAPLDLLEKGPNLEGLRQREPNRPRGGLRYDENSQGDVYDDSQRYANESNNYRNGDYSDGYDDNYYPATDEPIESSDAYYDDSQR